MEYIEGADLARVVREEGPMRPERACEYIRQAALGLEHAHERGLVHRDIKPANLLVASPRPSGARRSSGMIALKHVRTGSSELARTLAYPFGVVKILDMGLARCTDAFTGRAVTHLTQLGSIVGTPDFIAPEQARDSSSSDIRADLYSLGCTLYYLLTGQPPFPNGTTTEKFLQHQVGEPRPIAEVRRETLLTRNLPGRDEMLDVPTCVVDLVARLMRKLPQDRYQSPRELVQALEMVQGQLASPAKHAPEEVPTTELPALPPPPAVKPLVSLNVQRYPAFELADKLPVVLAAFAGLTTLFLVSVMAALLLR